MSTRSSPDLYQPRLRWYSQLWRLTLCAALSLLVWAQAWQGQWQDHRMLFWLDLGAGLVAYVLVMFRRRWPLPIALLTAALGAVSGVAAGPGTLAAVSLATRRRFLPVVATGIVAVTASQIYSDTQPLKSQDPDWFTLIVDIFITSAILAWGMYIGSRRELLWTLRDRAERAEAEQELRALNARNQERARIAREMHDVLAHRISQVSMHAGALTYREGLSPEEIRSSASVIQEKANEALDDLRAVLGVLREPQTGELVGRPQPTYDDLSALIEESREGGMHIEYSDLLEPGPSMPVAVGRTLYRIIQEGLTNARKHAPGALVRIQVSGSPDDGIDLLLRNAVGFSATPAAPGAGLGLIGLSERAQLRGGTLEHGRDGSTFVLHGWIPWAA